MIANWKLDACEGAVGDDARGEVYVAVEQKGVYLLKEERGVFSDPRKIVSVGDDGFVGDAEGLALVHREGQTFLVVSDQGASRFRVYHREADYALVGVFSVEGARDTDGIEFSAVPWPPEFADGIFACHTDVDGGRTILVSPAGPIWRLLEHGNN